MATVIGHLFSSLHPRSFKWAVEEPPIKRGGGGGGGGVGFPTAPVWAEPVTYFEQQNEAKVTLHLDLCALNLAAVSHNPAQLSSE